MSNTNRWLGELRFPGYKTQVEVLDPVIAWSKPVHIEDGETISQAVCAKGHVVEPKDIVEPEIHTLQLSGIIELSKFVPTSTIEPVCIAKSFYLLPQSEDSKDYLYLWAALLELNQAGLNDSGEYAVIPTGKGLTLCHLHSKGSLLSVPSLKNISKELKQSTAAEVFATMEKISQLEKTRVGEYIVVEKIRL